VTAPPAALFAVAAQAAAASDVATALSLVIAALVAASLLFAAFTLYLRARSTRAAARWARLEEAWTGPLLDVLAGDRPASDLPARVARRDRLRFADFLVRFARRLRGPELEQVGRIAVPYLQAVAARATAGSAEVRARSLLTLGLLQPGRFGAAITGGLDDPSPLVAMTAARVLARRDAAQHVKAILARLHRFRDWNPGFLASLIAGAGPAAAPPLRAMLADPRQPVESRIVAAEALRQLHDLTAAAPAAAIVAEGADHDLVAAALRLLAAVGSGAQAPAVREACASPDPVVRAQACAALGAVGAASDEALLGPALADPDPWVVYHAARSLKTIGGAALLEAAAGPAAGPMVRQVLAE